jgi:hypothetical protein
MKTSGIEPPTSWLQTRLSSVATTVNNEVASSQIARCTVGCTDGAASASDPSDVDLADYLASLTTEQRRRLADLLGEGQEERRELFIGA